MQPSSDALPRDSRLENFSAAAGNIISLQRGLTPAALIKIRHLAAAQHLTEDQIIACLDRIGAGTSKLGRVGRYEQVFLDRLNDQFSKTSATVLSPRAAREALEWAEEEFQISASRAQQLLDHVAQDVGLQQISAADAQQRTRMLIAQKLDSPKHLRGDFKAELMSYAANFGISADEVTVWLDTEIENRNQRKAGRNRWVRMVGTALLIALGVVAAGVWRWQNMPTPKRQIATTPTKRTESNSIQKKETVPETIPQPMVESSRATDEVASLKIDDFVSLEKALPASKFQKWQASFVELVGRDFQRSPSETTPPLLADRQRKEDAIEALRSEGSSERIKIRALDDLNVLSDRIEDVTAEEAEAIARFCFQQHDAALENAVLGSVKQYGRWPRFLLAVSDAFAISEQAGSASDWHRRIAAAITDGKLKSNNDLSTSFFDLARLRVKERVMAITQTQAPNRANIETQWVDHLRQFIDDQMHDRATRSYFHRLIDGRSVELPSMQRQIELQQILIEALLFAKLDDDSLAVGEAYFRRLNSAATMGQQLEQSRKAAGDLVTLHWRWLQRGSGVEGAGSQRDLRWLPDPARYTSARRWRDEAELMVLSGDGKQLSNAVEKYKSAIAVGDAAMTRSSLTGLVAIASTPADRNAYQRQLDFVNGGQMGPFSRFTGGGDGGSETAIGGSAQTQSPPPQHWRAISTKCLHLRGSGDSLEAALPVPAASVAEIWAALDWLANQENPLSLFELDVLLSIEATANDASQSTQPSLSSFGLPWPLQATLPPKVLTPLVPLPR